MKFLGRLALLTACMLAPGMQVFAEAFFGFAPLNPDADNLTAQGSGKNCYTEGAIVIDPVTNPAVASLKGKNITGVRVYMRSDYKQKSKRTSMINIRKGSLDAQPVKNYADFYAGWNEITLDSPVEIDDECIYIGPNVYETSGNPYPLVSVPGPSVSGGYLINLNKEGWQELTSRGVLLMQLIVDCEPEELPLSAAVGINDYPLVVSPGNDFACNMYVHNFSATPMEYAEIESVTDDGETVYRKRIDFDTPVAPFDSRTISTSLQAGTVTASAVDYACSVASINGTESAGPSTTVALHVTEDAFLRIPLIEEFTSMFCVNCPFMAYYLDIAMEEFDRPHVFVSRHSGFVPDLFTTDADRELLYVFNSPSTYNPAVMFDRTIFDESDKTPVMQAIMASSDPYLEKIELASRIPALARVVVDSEVIDGKVTCKVTGKIAQGVDLDNLSISASFIENGISADKVLQMGLDDYDDDPNAPEDLKERFKHNGVNRIVFNKEPLGDKLTVDPATREFEVVFEDGQVSADWNLQNCETIAFISHNNKADLHDNYILNAGGTRWNEAVLGSGAAVGNITNDRYSDGETMVFDMMGRRIITDDVNSLPKGLYIINGKKIMKR